ncbi:hypothetical protein BG015_008567 [Linnemannia schmuckeri]|uniref:Uncharacterized protein n=1 Tax=Linnemannia schmuckeri TaxID=64567 RepID=A0A9P5RXB2_9FUNG|nr:hypothetical protein BG015_008567 [Linnemannia schmuckeri]
MALSSSNYPGLSHPMSSFLSSLEYRSSSSITDTLSSLSTTTTATATGPVTTSSHPLPQQQKSQEQHTLIPTHINNNNSNSIEDENDQFQQCDSFMGLLNLLNSDLVGAQTINSATVTNSSNAIASSSNTNLWTALDGGNGSDWESEQLRSLLNLSDQDMDFFQDGIYHGLVDADDAGSSVGPPGQQSLLASGDLSTTVGPMMHQHGSLNAQHQYQQQLLLHQQQQQQKQHRQSPFENTAASTALRRHSRTPLINSRQPSYMTSSIPPPPVLPLSAAAEIKRPDTKESFIHPGFYSLPSPSQQHQRSSSQQQQQQSQQLRTPVKMGIKRSFQEDDFCPTTITATTSSSLSSLSSSSSSHRQYHHHGAMMKGIDLRRHSVDGYHVAAKAAAATTAKSTGGSTSPAPPHAWVYSTPPKTPNNLPTSMFHAHGHPHARASTVDYSQVPPGQPFMTTNAHVVASPLMSHHQYNANGAKDSNPGSSPFQPTVHFVRSLSSPAGTKLSAASAFNSSPTTSTTSSSGSNSNSGTPKKRRASKFRMDSTLSHATATAGIIPFDSAALLSHFGLVNTLPPPLQQQHPHTQSLGFQHNQPQPEHAILFQQQQQQQLQAAIRRQQQQQQQQQQHQHQQFAAAAAAAIGAAGGNRSGTKSIVGQQNAHTFLMQHLVSDPRLAAASAATAAAAGLAGATPLTSTKMQGQQGLHSSAATTYRRNPGEVPSSTLPPDHFIFQEATLLNRQRQQAAQQYHAQQQQQAKQAQQAKQQAQQQGSGRTRSNSVVPTTTAGVQVGSMASDSGGKLAASRRRSEPVSLYQQHQQQQHQQQFRLLQAQQAQQYQHQQLHSKSQSEQGRSIKDHQQRPHHHHQQCHQQQQQRLAKVVEANSLFSSPISTSSSSSPASSSAACESAIPCGPVITLETTSAAAAEDVTVRDVNDVGKKPPQSEVGFDMSSIATATKAVEASSTTSTPVTEQKTYQDTKAATVGPNTDSEIPLITTITVEEGNLKSESAQADIKSIEEKPEQQVTEEDIKQEVEEEKYEDEEEKEEPLLAAKAFAKSLTTVTTTLDPAATQLMDQLRLQEYLRVSVSTSLPIGTPTTTMLGDSRSK